MIFFYDLEKYSNNIAVVKNQYEKISYKSLINIADKIGTKTTNNSLVFVVCKNCYEVIAGYIGFMRSGAKQLLIGDTIDSSLFTNLQSLYKPAYIFLPTKKLGLKIDGTPIYTIDGYTLLKTKFKIDYEIHNDLAILLSTSGSTGSQKYVRQSYKNINSNADAIARYLEITSTDRPITTMPMNYTYALSIINSHLMRGSSIVLTDATLLVRRFWDEFANNSVTTFGGVPYIYEILTRLRFETMNLPSLKYITQAGGKLSSKLTKNFSEACIKKNIKFYVMYGQAEATARMSYLPWEYSSTKSGSIGNAIPGGEFWLEDKNRNVITESGTTGELIYQGENVTMGYAKSCYDLYKGDENKGILRTGDLAKRDVDGFYYITARIKRFLKMYGNRVNLDEIEELLRVAGYECVCAGTDDNLKIYVTNTNNKTDVLSHISKLTGLNRICFTCEHIDSIPRNESGKVMYSALD